MSKLSLEAATANLDVEAHNSNINNLAGALRYLAESERDAEEAYTNFKEAAAKLRADITSLASKDVANLKYEEVKGPYSMARTISLAFTPGNSKSW